MPRSRFVCAAVAAALFVLPLDHAAHAQKETKPAPKSGSTKKAGAKQAEAALKGKAFATVAAADPKVKAAHDAKDLDGAKKLIGKTGTFTGTVAKVFEPNGIAILNFDKNYKDAITGVVRGANFSKFPDLKTLVGKKVLITGSVKEYKGNAEVTLEKMDDIKIVKE